MPKGRLASQNHRDAFRLRKNEKYVGSIRSSLLSRFRPSCATFDDDLVPSHHVHNKPVDFRTSPSYFSVTHCDFTFGNVRQNLQHWQPSYANDFDQSDSIIKTDDDIRRRVHSFYDPLDYFMCPRPVGCFGFDVNRRKALSSTSKNVSVPVSGVNLLHLSCKFETMDYTIIFNLHCCFLFRSSTLPLRLRIESCSFSDPQPVPAANFPTGRFGLFECEQPQHLAALDEIQQQLQDQAVSLQHDYSDVESSDSIRCEETSPSHISISLPFELSLEFQLLSASRRLICEHKQIVCALALAPTAIGEGSSIAGRARAVSQGLTWWKTPEPLSTMPATCGGQHIDYLHDFSPWCIGMWHG